MLNRFDGNVVPFASEATLTNRTVFGAETQSDDIDDNLNADFKRGWEIVGVNDNPTREDFNAMGYTLGNLISYLYQNGVSEYNELQEYKTNSIAIASDGSIYQSLVDDNIGNALTDATKWICIASKNSIVNSIDELKTISNIEAVNALGYYTKGDDGGGLFYWDSTSTEADNGGSIVSATGVTTGRWKRVYNGAVNVKWFGASNNLTNSETQLNNSLLNNYNIVLPSETLKITTALKIPSYRKIDGKSFSAYTGSASESKNSIKKTSNTLVTITNFQSSVATNIDCIAYIDPYWINGGSFYPQAVELNNVAFEGNTTPNNIGLYIEQGGNLVFNNITFTKSTYNVRAKECWTTAFNQCRGDGVFDWRGGTSLILSTCWFGNGYNFEAMQYSTLISCATDGAIFSAYSINNSKMVLNGCGCENVTSLNATTGTAINATGGNNLEINGFNCVPQVGQTNPIFSVNDGDYVVFNGGSSSYMTGLTCADLQVNFANATVIFNDYTFHNGSKDNPNIKFDSSASGSSKVIVNYGKLTKIYVCDSSGNTIVYDGKIKDVKSTRAFNITYTNTIFKDMIVAVACGAGATGSYATAQVDGITVGIGGTILGTATSFITLTFKVPIGSTYIIYNTGTLTINSWTEER